MTKPLEIHGNETGLDGKIDAIYISPKFTCAEIWRE